MTPEELTEREESRAIVSLVMTQHDAQTFYDDWLLDPRAPVLSGGFQENDVYILGMRVEP